MARIFQTGLETGSVDPLTTIATVNTTLETTVTRGSWSSYAAKIGTSSGYAHWTLGAGYGEFYMGFGFHTGSISAIDTLTCRSPDGTVQCSLEYGASGQLLALRGTTTTLGSGGQLVANTWHWIECHIIISNTVGEFTVKLDGVQVINVTGADTQAHASETTVQTLRFEGSVAPHYFDDIVINDTTGAQNTSWPGDVRVSGYTPNADGDVSGLTLSTGTSHYAVVDERPPNDATDYAYDSVVNDYDLLNIPNTSGISSVQAVTLWLRAQKSDAGAANIAHMLKSGATEDTGSDVALSTSWTYHGKVYNVDPTDSGAWTTGKLDALQIGAKCR